MWRWKFPHVEGDFTAPEAVVSHGRYLQSRRDHDLACAMAWHRLYPLSTWPDRVEQPDFYGLNLDDPREVLERAERGDVLTAKDVAKVWDDVALMLNAAIWLGAEPIPLSRSQVVPFTGLNQYKALLLVKLLHECVVITPKEQRGERFPQQTERLWYLAQ
jgi:hypothetical protein